MTVADMLKNVDVLDMYCKVIITDEEEIMRVSGDIRGILIGFGDMNVLGPMKIHTAPDEYGHHHVRITMMVHMDSKVSK